MIKYIILLNLIISVVFAFECDDGCGNLKWWERALVDGCKTHSGKISLNIGREMGEKQVMEMVIPIMCLVGFVKLLSVVCNKINKIIK